MAIVAIVFCLGWVIKAGHTVPGYSRQVVGVLVILSPQPFVVIQLWRQVNLVATTTKPGLAVQRLEKGFLVQFRFCLDQLAIDPLQCLVVTERERVVLRRLDRKIGVAARAVDLSDGMATGAGDAGAGQRIVQVAKIGVIECPAEQGNRVVAAGAETRNVGIAVPCHAHLAGFHH